MLYFIIIILLAINSFSENTKNAKIYNQTKQDIQKITNKIKNHIKNINKLSMQEKQKLNSFYQEIKKLYKSEKSCIEKLSIEVKNYIEKESAMRRKLISELDINRLSSYYKSDEQNQSINSDFHPSLKKNTKKNNDLVENYNKFVNSTPLDIRIQAQKIRSMKYELFLEKRKLLEELPEKLKILLKYHFRIKRESLKLNKALLKQIIIHISSN